MFSIFLFYSNYFYIQVFLLAWRSCLSGFLFSLLAGLAHHSTHSLRHDVDTQTTSLASYGESLGMINLCLILFCVVVCFSSTYYLVLITVFFFSVQLTRWKWLTNGMRALLWLKTKSSHYNQNFQHIKKRLRHKRKQKWKQRY